MGGPGHAHSQHKYAVCLLTILRTSSSDRFRSTARTKPIEGHAAHGATWMRGGSPREHSTAVYPTRYTRAA